MAVGLAIRVAVGLIVEVATGLSGDNDVVGIWLVGDGFLVAFGVSLLLLSWFSDSQATTDRSKRSVTSHDHQVILIILQSGQVSVPFLGRCYRDYLPWSFQVTSILRTGNFPVAP